MLRRYPFLLLLSGLLCGLAAGNLGAGWWIVSLLTLSAAGIYLAALLRSRTPSGAVKAAPLHYCWVGVLAMAVGTSSSILHRPYADNAGDYPLVIGTVEDARQTTTSARMTVRADAFADADGRVREHPQNLLLVLSTDRYFEPGARICFIRDLKPLEENLNVQDDSYTRWLRSCGVAYRQWSPEEAVWEVGQDERMRFRLLRFRDGLAQDLETSQLSDISRQLLGSIALGDRSMLDQDSLQTFRLSGLGHILAISGLHVGIVALLLSLLLFPLTMIAPAKWHWVGVIVLLWCYACLTGLQTAAVRACVMMTFCLGALVLERRNTSCNALMAAAFFILLFEPNQLATAGFQLSFVAAGMLILSSSLNPVDHHRHHFLYRITEIFLSTTAAMAGTLALSAYHFHNLPLSAFLPNILVGLLMPFYLGFGLVYIAGLCLGVDFAWLAWLIDRGTEGLMYMAENVASRSVLHNVWVHGSVPLLVAASLFCLLFWQRTRRKALGIAGGSLALAAVGCILWLPSGKPCDGFIVQQADRVAIYLDGRENLVDIEKGTGATLDVIGHRIAWCTMVTDSIPSCDFLLLGDGFEGDLSHLSFKPQIVLLASLYENDRESLLRQCRSLGLSVHDIDAVGPLRTLDSTK